MKNNNRNIFIFDFDGVLCNSIEECMIVSFDAYRSTLSNKVEQLSNSMKEYFYIYRYLVGPAGEYYLIWESYYYNKDFKQISFEEMKKDRAVEINDFQNEFFIYREKLKQNFNYWISLHKPYINTLKFFKRFTDKIFILTNKDKDSVKKISSAHGYYDKIKGIYSKEISNDKSVLLENLFINNQFLRCGYNLYYIDDNINNLDLVSALNNPNLICILAQWGYCADYSDISYFMMDDILDIQEVIRS